MARITLALITVLVVASCGGQPATTTPTATQTPAITQAIASPTTAPTAAPTAVPTAISTVVPTATPRPTPKLPLLVEVTSDQDVAENFICKTPAEVTDMISGMTVENFKSPLMFNPRGKKFTLSVYETKFQDGRIATLFVIKLSGDSEVILMSYLPTWMGLEGVTYGAETLFKMVPFDETKPTQAAGTTFFFPGGRGVYTEVTGSAEPLMKVDAPGLLTPNYREVGKPILRIKAGAKPISAWPGNGHIVIRGGDFDPKANTSPITKDSRLMEGNKQVAICS